MVGLLRMVSSFRVIRAFLAVSLLLLASGAQADSVEIFDLKFEVDAIKESRSGVVELTLFGEKELLPKQAKNSRIVSRYFSDLDKQENVAKRVAPFPINQLESFVAQAIANKKNKIAGLGLAALVVHPQSTQNLVDETIWKASNEQLDTISQTAFKSVKDSRPSNGSGMPLIAVEAYFRPQKVISRLDSLVGDSRPDFINYLARRHVLNLMDGKGTIAQEILKNFQPLFESEPTFFDKLVQLGEVIPPVVKGFKEGKETNVLALRDLATNDKRIEAVLAPAYTSFINDTAQSFVEKERYGYALWLLSKVSFESRTLTTHKLTLAALRKLKSQARSPILRTGVSSFLSQISEEDSQIKKEYIRLLEEQIRYVLNENHPERFNIFFGLLQAVNPDPSILNDKLRLKHADYYLSKNDKKTAVVILRSLKGALSFTSKLWINFRIVWLEYPLIVVAIFLFFVVMIAIAVIRVVATLSMIDRASSEKAFVDPHAKQEEDEIPEQAIPNPDNVSHADDEDIPLFVKGGAATQLTPIAHEYLSLLNIFDLNPGATAQDVKRIYREEMKRLHPDMGNTPNNSEDTEAIMRYKAAYTRIMEMERDGLITEEEKAALKRRSEILHSW